MSENQHEEAMARLEAVVENLLTGFNGLKQEKLELEAKLRQKEYEVEELQEVMTTLKEEKSLVYRRVSGLLNSIEEWERSQVVA